MLFQAWITYLLLQDIKQDILTDVCDITQVWIDMSENDDRIQM